MLKRTLVTLALIALPCATLASPIGLGDAGGYTLLATGTMEIDGDISVGNNVDINGKSGAATFEMGNNSRLQGDLDYGSTYTVGNNSTITGTITQHSGNDFWTNLQNDLSTASSGAFSEGGMDKGGITGTQTLQRQGSLSVFNLDKLQLGNNESLTLSGDSGDQFIINVGDASALKLGNNASITLAGGVKPGDVLFNFIGDEFEAGNNVTLAGNFIVPDGLIDLSNNMVLGSARLLGKNIIIGNNTGVGGGIGSGTPPSTSVPEPSTLLMMGLGLVLISVGFSLRRRYGQS